MSMPSKNKPHSTKFNFYEPENLGAITGRVEAKSRMYAKKIHELGWIYALYGGLDGVSLSHSTIKYVFDLFLANSKTSASDAMHEWMMTPEGIAVAATESVSIIVFSLLANIFDDKDQTSDVKRYIAVIWPYIRDVMKVKNSFKGVKSAIQVVNLVGGIDLNFLMLPGALVLGGLAIINRIWFRYMYTLRKDMMDATTQALADIQYKDSLTAEECRKIRVLMEQNKQTKETRIMAMFSSMFAGMVDSLYLYVGVLSLCALVWPALVVMTAFCAVYSLGCVLSRMYEEYNFQRKLLIKHAQIDLNLYSKEHATGMQTCFARLHEISKLLASGVTSEELLEEQHQLAKDIADKIKNFTEKRAHLQELMTLSYSSAFMAGVINGLAAYRALASGMFAFATVFFLTSTAFPPALLITCISVGMALLIGFIAHSMINNYWHRAKQAENDSHPYERLSHVLQVLKDVKLNQGEEISAEEVKEVICLGAEVKSSPKYYYEEVFEISRSFCSGPAKGSKFTDFTLNPLQVADAHGHYHDTPVMLGLTVVSSFVYSLCLALRAFARGFGRDDSPQPTENPEDMAAQCSKIGAKLSQDGDFELSSSYEAGADGSAGSAGVAGAELPDKGLNAPPSLDGNNWGSFFNSKLDTSSQKEASCSALSLGATAPGVEKSDITKKTQASSSLSRLSFFSTPSDKQSGKTCKQQENLFAGGLGYVDASSAMANLVM